MGRLVVAWGCVHAEEQERGERREKFLIHGVRLGGSQEAPQHGVWQVVTTVAGTANVSRLAGYSHCFPDLMNTVLPAAHRGADRAGRR